MGSDKTPNYLRGFILPLDISIANFWQSETNISQQNPRAGDPIPQQSSKMRLLASGNQSDGGDITVVTRKGGSAGYGSRFTFKENNISTSVEYGRDAYNAISGFEIDILGSSTNNYRLPTGLVTTSESLLVSYQWDTAVGSTLHVKRYDKDGNEATTTVFSKLSTVTTTQRFHSTMAQLEDGSIILVFILEDDGEANIRVLRSVDDGASFDVASRESLSTTIPVGTTTGAGVNTYNIIRMRMASITGSIVLLVETEINNTLVTKRNQLFQFVSIDGGSNFTRISTDDNLESNSFRKVNLATRLGRYVISYVATTGGLQYMELPNPFSNIHLLRESSAYVNLLGVPNAAGGSNDYMTGGDTAMLVDSDGTIYVYAYSGATNYFIVSQVSQDGQSFKFTNGNYTIAQGTTLECDDSFTRLRDMFGVVWKSTGLIVSNADSSSTLDNSVVLTYLGGYSTLNLPQTAYEAPQADWSRAGYIRNYLPLDEPTSITGLSVLGTGNDILTGGNLRITSSVGFPSFRYYSWNNLPTSATATDYTEQGIIIRSSCIATTGGDTTNNRRGFTLQMDNGTNRYKIEVDITTTQIVLKDITGGSTIATINHDNTQGVDILCALGDANKVSAWYRTYTLGGLRTWNEIAINQTVGSAASTGADHEIIFGHLAWASGTLQTEWREFHVSTLTATGMGLASGFVNPDDLATRAYPPLGQYSYIYDGVSISSTDGPTYEGEEFQILPEYDYPIDNILYSQAPSPRIQWRSEKTLVGNIPSQSIAFSFNEDSSLSYVENMPNDLMGFHLNGVNWRSGDIYYYFGGAWQLLTSIDNQIQCSCVASGRTVRGTTGGDEPYFTLNELVGWTAFFNMGILGTGYRKVISNTEGKFGGTSTTTKQATVIFDTAPPQGSGTIYFIPPVFSMVVSMNGKKAKGFKIVTDTQQTYDNDIRIGELIMGPVIIPGRQYGRGRTIQIQSGTVTIETQDGVRYSREISPPTRVFNLAWTDGIDISQLQGDSPDIDYWMSSNQSGAEPIAVNNEAPDLMIGFLRYIQGAVKHFVYLPNVTKSTSLAQDKRYLNREKEQALVTLEGDVQIEHVVGDELQVESGEVFRIATITLKEVK